MEIPDLTSAISTLQELISEDNSVVETGGSVVTKRILDLVEDQEDNDQQQVSEEKDVSTRSDRKSQVKQCLSKVATDPKITARRPDSDSRSPVPQTRYKTPSSKSVSPIEL